MKKFKIVPPVYFLIYIILIITFHFLFMKFNIINFPYNLLGLLFFIFGLVLNSISMNLFKKEDTPEELENKPNVLVIRGAYKYSRNPMYLGGLISLIGLAIISQNILSFIIPILYIITINIIFIQYEEKILEQLFGNEYLEYKHKVRRWI